MKHARIRHAGVYRGFTLIESLIVLVVLAIAAVVIASLQGNILYRQADNTKIQVGVQIMQECAEQLLATASSVGGFDSPSLADSTAASTSCSGMTLSNLTFTSAAPTVTITNGNSATIPACPSAIACKLVSVTQGGLTPLVLMLVSY